MGSILRLRSNYLLICQCLNWLERYLGSSRHQGWHPGVKKEEVKVEVEEGRIIQISGERNVEKGNKNEKWHRVERSSVMFLKTLRMPKNAKVDRRMHQWRMAFSLTLCPRMRSRSPRSKLLRLAVKIWKSSSSSCPILLGKLSQIQPCLYLIVHKNNN